MIFERMIILIFWPQIVCFDLEFKSKNSFSILWMKKKQEIVQSTHSACINFQMYSETSKVINLFV